MVNAVGKRNGRWGEANAGSHLGTSARTGNGNGAMTMAKLNYGHRSRSTPALRSTNTRSSVALGRIAHGTVRGIRHMGDACLACSPADTERAGSGAAEAKEQGNSLVRMEKI